MEKEKEKEKECDECSGWSQAIRADHLGCLIEHSDQREYMKYLELACKKKRWSIVRYLVERYLPRSRCCQVLRKAIERQHLTCMIQLIRPTDLSAITYGLTENQLLLALQDPKFLRQNRDGQILGYLLSQYSSCSTCSSTTSAITSGHLVCLIKFLLQSNEENIRELIPGAIQFGRLEILNLLIEAPFEGWKIPLDEAEGTQLIQQAIVYGREDCVRYLLDAPIEYTPILCYRTLIEHGWVEIMKKMEADYTDYLIEDLESLSDLARERNQIPVLHHYFSLDANRWHYSFETLPYLQHYLRLQIFYQLIRATIVLRRWIRRFLARYHAPHAKGFRQTQQHFRSLSHSRTRLRPHLK